MMKISPLLILTTTHVIAAPDFTFDNTAAGCMANAPPFKKAHIINRKYGNKSKSTVGVYALQNHRGGFGNTSGVWFYDSESGKIVDCVLGSNVHFADDVETDNKGFFQHVEFGDDNRGVEKYDNPNNNMSNSSTKYNDRYSRNEELKIVMKFRRINSVRTKRFDQKWTDLVVDENLQPLYRLEVNITGSRVIGEKASTGFHDGHIDIRDKDLFFQQIWDVRENLTFTNLDGTESTQTLAAGAFQVRDSRTGAIVQEYTGWGEAGDESCLTELRCQVSISNPSRYMRYGNLQTDGGKGTHNSNTHTNAMTQVVKEHWDPPDEHDSVLSSERQAGIVNKINLDGTLAWRFHGKLDCNNNTINDFPWLIENDDLFEGPTDFHHVNVENLQKNNIMLLDNGRVRRGDPCHPSLELTEKDFENIDNSALKTECEKAPKERRGCPLSRAVEFEILAGKTFKKNKARKVWSYPADNTLPNDLFLPFNEKYWLHPLGDEGLVNLCMPFWRKFGPYASYISSARRLENGNTVVGWHECSRCGTPKSRVWKNTVIFQEVTKEGITVNKFLTDRTEKENYHGAFRVDFIEKKRFRKGKYFDLN
eukprot:Pgem_evm1s19279